MKNKLKSFISDRYQIGMVVLDLLLLASMWFNPELTWNYFSYFTLISRIIFPLIVFFFGNKGMWIFYYVTAIVRTLDISFDDFTALTAFCILFLFIKPKYKWLKFVTVISYLISVFCVAALHHKQPYHLFAHFIGCCILSITVYKLFYIEDNRIRSHKSNLHLTHDEVLIIEELLKGKQQKEIEMFSQNTVCTKLKQARNRNGLKTTDELLMLYRSGDN